MKLYRIAEDQNSNSYDPYDRVYENMLHKIRRIITSRNYTEKFLNNDKKSSILFTPRFDKNKKNILIIAGQHGEEIAGPYGLLKFLNDNPKLLEQVNISFVPVVNVHGFENNIRNGTDDTYTNFFLNEDRSIRELGYEAQGLLNHLDLLGYCAKDGLINLHEDSTAEGFYLYVLGDNESSIVQNMLRVGKEFFEFKRDGNYSDNDDYELKNGVISNHPDKSFDDLMKSKFHIELVVTIETPQVDAKIPKRAEAISAMTSAYIQGIIK